jgi:superfamily II DNA helicase RecQ
MDQLTEFIRPIVEAGGKAVIMCNDIERIKSIIEAAAFPCEPFHKKMDEHVRNETFEAFRAVRTPVLVATSVFGTGIDIPDVRLIIHITEPDNMREYGQESGRCGRDGQPSRAVIIRQNRPRDERMRAYIDEMGCRRVKLDGYLDGDTSRTQCREGEVKCDWCQAESVQNRAPPPGFAPKAVMVAAPPVQITYGTPPATQQSTECPSSTPSSTHPQSSANAFRQLERTERERTQPDERRLQQSQDRRVWHEDLRQRLNRWKNVCVVCHSQGKDSMHTINRCASEDSVKAERERKYAQRAVKFPQSQVCFKCGVPRLICDRWSSDGRARVYDEEGMEVECQFYGLLLGVIYGVKHAYPDIWKRWFEAAKRDGGWRGDMVEFLGS